jgi:hypothetical protein
VIESATSIAELICRYAVFEEVYLLSPSPARDELERALIKLYAAILTYLAKAKSYFEQNSASQFKISNCRISTDEINRAYFEERTSCNIGPRVVL